MWHKKTSTTDDIKQPRHITQPCHIITWFFNACTMQGRIQDSKLGGGGLKKNCAEWRETQFFWGYFMWKITILRKKIIFFSNFRRGARRVRLPWIRPWPMVCLICNYLLLVRKLFFCIARLFKKFTYSSVLNIKYARFEILVSCLVYIYQLLI